MAHLIIGGRDTRDFGLTLTSVDMRPPAPKEIVVSGNGFDGSIDLTSWTGRTFFNDRQMNFEFVYTDYTDPASFERVKSEVSSALHGMRLGFRLSWEPDSIYIGRWKVESTATDGHHGVIALACTADPYKAVRVAAASVWCLGGAYIDGVMESGVYVTAPANMTVNEYGDSPIAIAAGETVFIEGGEPITVIFDRSSPNIGFPTVANLSSLVIADYSGMSVAEFMCGQTHPFMVERMQHYKADDQFATLSYDKEMI